MIMLKAVEDLGQVGSVGRFTEMGNVLMRDVFLSQIHLVLFFFSCH